MVARFSIWGVDLNPVLGSEQAGYRPVLVISPPEMNDRLNTVIVAPMTTVIRGWPSRVQIRHNDKNGEVALDQMRTIDKQRLVKQMGDLDYVFQGQVLATLYEIFSE